MASCVRELAESGLPVPTVCEACGDRPCKRDMEDAFFRIAGLEGALRDARQAISEVEIPQQRQVVDLLARIDGVLNQK